MNVHGNSIVSRNNLIGYLVGYPEPIWYYIKVITNILPIVLVEKNFPVMYRNEKCFIVVKGNRNKRCLIISERVIYSLEMASPTKNIHPPTDGGDEAQE